MTPKERFLMALNHQEPDRVPVGEWQYGPEIIDRVLGKKTIFMSGLEKTKALWNGERNRVIEDWKTSLVELARRLEWDAVLVHNVIGESPEFEVPEQVADDQWRYENGDILTYSKETDRLMFTNRGEKTVDVVPDSDSETKVDVEAMVPTDAELEVVRHVVKELGRTHFVFSAPLQGHPKLNFSDATVSEVENWVRLYEDPDKFGEELMKGLSNPVLRRGVRAAKEEGMDGVATGWDFGCNTGPFMAPDLFRKVILPYLSGYADIVHEQNLPLLLHSCGNNQELMDMIVEAGIDVYQSIQTEMDIRSLKKRYGKNITLWGGFPAGDLITSTPDEVCTTARDYLECCKPGGGFVFGTSHSVMPGAKYENYMAMLEAHKKYGNYS